MNLESARQQMVLQQVRAWEVLDSRVLEVLGSTPREDFVPAAYAPLAFADTEIPLPCGQQMLAPKLEGRILQALDLNGEETVLEIGTGSGFLSACLARLARQVTSIEYHEELSNTAAQRLDDQAIRNVTLEIGDAMACEYSRSYDAIAVTASAPRRLARLENALKPGGRLFIVVGQAPIMEARLITRVGDNSWTSESLFETSVPALINAEQPNPFVF